jgi:hypothetical protein
VDPNNRRPVDLRLRGRFLSGSVYLNVLAGWRVVPAGSRGQVSLRASDLLSDFPVALIQTENR